MPWFTSPGYCLQVSVLFLICSCKKCHSEHSYPCLCIDMHAVLQDIHLGVEFLGPGVCVWSNLLDNAKLFSKVVAPIHTFTSSVCWIPVFYILADTWLLRFLKFFLGFDYHCGLLLSWCFSPCTRYSRQGSSWLGLWGWSSVAGLGLEVWGWAI